MNIWHLKFIFKNLSICTYISKAFCVFLVPVYTSSRLQISGVLTGTQS